LERTAQVYVQIARLNDGEYAAIADFTLSGALDAIADQPQDVEI
jgi:hypothetical protein